MFNIFKKKKAQAKTIPCFECKCLGYESDFKKVVSVRYRGMIWPKLKLSRELFYCQKCKPAYDAIEDEMTQKGEIITHYKKLVKGTPDHFETIRTDGSKY